MIKKHLPQSLFYRSLLILTVPIILTMAISTYVFFDRHWEKMAGRLAVGVAGEVAFFVDQVADDIDQEDFENQFDYLSRQSLAHMQMNLQIIDGGAIKEDPVQYAGREDVIKSFLYKELKTKLNKPFRVLVDTQEKWIQVQVQLRQGALVVTVPERRLFSSSGYVFLIWMIGVSIVLMAVAILFMRNQIRPIKKLAVVAERFGKGRDAPFFKPQGAREVRQAGRAFLEMRDRINNQIKQRTFMLAGVSHDLRTPLTRMKLQAEMIEDAQEKKALQGDINEMERMITAYLEFTKGEGDEKSQEVNVEETLKNLLSSFEKLGLKNELEVVDGNYTISLRPVAFERSINNILSNAEYYASKVYVTLNRQAKDILITIEDDGPGLSEEEYDDVFKPFYRAEKSRNKKTGGVGLGLPITQDIITSHGGKVELGESGHGGLKVTVTIPE